VCRSKVVLPRGNRTRTILIRQSRARLTAARVLHFDDDMNDCCRRQKGKMIAKNQNNS
jgi:hypothetical protein